jgi:hypothetical protein
MDMLESIASQMPLQLGLSIGLASAVPAVITANDPTRRVPMLTVLRQPQRV